MSNDSLVIVGVPSREAGHRAIDRVDAAVEEGIISVEDVALVYKNEKGKVKVHQTADATAAKGAIKGGALGLLVAVVAAPLVPAVAVGAGVGALIGKARDRGISDALMQQAGKAIDDNGAAVFVLTDQSSAATIGAMVEDAVAGGAKVDYMVLPAEAQDFLREAIKLSDS